MQAPTQTRLVKIPVDSTNFKGRTMYAFGQRLLAALLAALAAPNA